MYFTRSVKALSQRLNVTRSIGFRSISIKSFQPVKACVPSTLRFYSTEGSLTTDNIQSRIFEVLKGYEKIDQKSITPTAHFTKDLKLDSLDTVEVVMAIEEEFSIEIPDHDADEIKSVQDAINYVQSRKDAV